MGMWEKKGWKGACSRARARARGRAVYRLRQSRHCCGPRAINDTISRNCSFIIGRARRDPVHDVGTLPLPLSFKRQRRRRW